MESINISSEELTLQEKDRLGRSKVLDHAVLRVSVSARRHGSRVHDPLESQSVSEIHCRERGGKTHGRDRKQGAQNDALTPNPRKIPFARQLGVGCIIVGNSESSDIGENGEENDEFYVDRAVQNDEGSHEENFEVQAEGDPVDDVGLHAMEDLATCLEGVDDRSETGSDKNDVGRAASS